MTPPAGRGWAPVVRLHLAGLAMLVAAAGGCSPLLGPEGPVGFRVASWNVALGTGYRLPLATANRSGSVWRWALHHHRALAKPDVLALQEVCLTRGRQLDWLVASMQQAHGGARIWQAHATDGGQLDRDCSCAQVTLSRWPVRNAGRLELPLLSWRNAALWTDLDIADHPAPWNVTGRLRVYNLHLINRVGRSVHVPSARLQQAQAVLAHHAAFRRREPQTPVLWAGDFNTLDHWLQPWQREPVLEQLAQRMTPSLRGYQPTHLLLQQLDWIFADGLRPQRSHVVLLPLSDHLPVVADF